MCLAIMEARKCQFSFHIIPGVGGDLEANVLNCEQWLSLGNKMRRAYYLLDASVAFECFTCSQITSVICKRTNKII